MQNNVALMPQRPPYVEFEQRSEEDREATIKAGHYVARDIDYAIIRAIGAKDAVEKPAAQWLEHIERQASRGQYRREWVQFFRQQYEDWKKGFEPTPNGLHVRQWPGASRAEVDMLVAAKIYTVEDLAEANEEALTRVGMGARGLKQRARAWLDTASKNGSAEELASLRERTANQEKRIEALLEQIAELTAEVKALRTGEAEVEQPAPRRRRANAD
jgi:hypothetical protein